VKFRNRPTRSINQKERHSYLRLVCSMNCHRAPVKGLERTTMLLPQRWEASVTKNNYIYKKLTKIRLFTLFSGPEDAPEHETYWTIRRTAARDVLDHTTHRNTRHIRAQNATKHEMHWTTRRTAAQDVLDHTAH
jgi:hypothetical protein